MAQATGADQDILHLDADHLYDLFEKTLWHTERTIYNALGVAKHLMSRHFVAGDVPRQARETASRLGWRP
jgi:hypothetical protein